MKWCMERQPMTSNTNSKCWCPSCTAFDLNGRFLMKANSQSCGHCTSDALMKILMPDQQQRTLLRNWVSWKRQLAWSPDLNLKKRPAQADGWCSLDLTVATAVNARLWGRVHAMWCGVSWCGVLQCGAMPANALDGKQRDGAMLLVDRASWP